MKALIVDDDRTLADLLAFTLRRAGFESHLAFDAPNAIRIFDIFAFDVVILDVNMPGEPGLRDGFDVCKLIRQKSEVPIILLTVRSEEEDVIKGLSLGADDYVSKPFSPSQLVARVQSLIRRSSGNRVSERASFTFMNFTFNPNLREVLCAGTESIQLTRLEARLLEYFMVNEGQFIPAENIISYVWGVEGGNKEMLRQLVHRLRDKIESDPAKPELITNLPGVGYGFGV